MSGPIDLVADLPAHVRFEQAGAIINLLKYADRIELVATAEGRREGELVTVASSVLEDACDAIQSLITLATRQQIQINDARSSAEMVLSKLTPREA